MALRRAPELADYPADLTGDAYSQLLDTELRELWNYVSMPLTSVAGTGNTITANSVVPLLAAPVAGMRTTFRPFAANTGAATIDIDSKGAKAIVSRANNALVGGELVTGLETDMVFDGTSWRLLGLGWQTVRKVADQSKTTDTTLANDTALTFPLLASRKYTIRGRIMFSGPATPGFKYALTGPASPTLVQVERWSRAPNATSLVVAGDAAYTSSTSITGNATSHGLVEFEAIIQNGANAGTFAFQWAQGTSSGTATVVRAGSYLEVLDMG